MSLLAGRLASHRTALTLAFAAISIAARVCLLPWIPIPQPAVQDEFSYLLAGDTFASGRLTNPQHPLWMHFETIHEIVRPTYQSKYPPAQGLVLALGQAAFRNPWFGILLSMGALNAAIYWALSGWLSPRWALLGGLLALTRVGFLSYWSESYWGGAVAAAAGALVIGAVARLRKNPKFSTGLILGAGLAILANSRPYEGLLLAIVCLGAILIKVSARTLVLPLAIILIATGLWMGYYNYRVTGNALLMPYQVHDQQYETTSFFVWDRHFRPPPHYNDEALRAEWIDWAQNERAYEQSHPWATKQRDFIRVQQVLFGIPLTCCVVLYFLPLLDQPKMRFAIVLVALYTIGLCTETTVLPHYAAPGTAFAFIFGAASLRRLCHLSSALMLGVLAIILGSNFVVFAAPDHRALWDKRDFIARRDAALRQLNQAPGKHLVLLEYGPGHDVNYEFLYNRADIDASQIVWAREMGPEKDQELLDYYPDRDVWRLVDRGDGLTLTEIRGTKR